MNKGDKCRVRLHTGEVAEAIYSHASTINFKVHFVRLPTGDLAIAWGRKPMFSTVCMAVRFVGNPCVLLHEGVSV